MIKHLAPLALAAAVAAGARAETRTVDVSDFSALDVANGVSVEVTLGASPAVVVDGPADQIEHIDVAVSGDALHVRPTRSGWFRRTRVDDVTVRVSAPSLSAVDVANGALVSVEDVPDSAELRLTAVNGGMLEAKGACLSVEVEAHRGGMANASDLDCRDAVAKATMGGMASVRASASHTATASMGGHVEMLGEADEVTSNASMGGFVSRAGEE